MTIQLEIEEVVLHGVSGISGDALANELRRVIADRIADGVPAPAAGAARPAVDAGHIAAGPTPGELTTGIAGAVSRAVLS
jgi:hypothetical protein